MPSGVDPAGVVLVEVGAAGWAGVPDRVRALLVGADVLVGDPAVLTEVPRSFAQAREPWPEDVGDLLARHAGWSIVGIVAADPWSSAPGRRLLELLGPALQVEPGVPAVSLASARLGWVARDLDVLDLTGRGASALARELADGRRLLVLGAGDLAGDLAVTALLCDSGYGASRVVALSRLGAPDEAVLDATAQTWPEHGVPSDVLALDLAGPLTSPWLAGLPDAAYDPVGVTPRDLRAAALARLAPQPGQRLWDLGSGGGSVAIEWLRAHRSCRALAVEDDPDRVVSTTGNARRLGVPDLEVVLGGVPGLAAHDAPDAVFLAGVHAHPVVLDACLGLLRPGGRLVVQVATPAGQAWLGETYAALGGELTRVAVDVASWADATTRWTSRPAVTQWAWQS